MDASCLWLFKSSVNNSVLSDEVSGRNIHLEGGALITNTTERGLVVDTNGGWISLKETNGKFRRNDVNNCNKRVNSIKEKVYLSQLNDCEGRRRIYWRRPFLLLIVWNSLIESNFVLPRGYKEDWKGRMFIVWEMTWIIIIILVSIATILQDSIQKNPYIREQRFSLAWGSRRWPHVIIAGVVMKYISVKTLFFHIWNFKWFYCVKR